MISKSANREFPTAVDGDVGTCVSVLDFLTLDLTATYNLKKLVLKGLRSSKGLKVSYANNQRES